MGDQGRQVGKNAEEPLLFRYYNRILEFNGRDLLTGRMDAMGHAQLRQGPADAGDGHGPWSLARAFSRRQDWDRLQREIETPSTEKQLCQPKTKLNPSLIGSGSFRQPARLKFSSARRTSR